jgi:hypothetical protein
MAEAKERSSTPVIPSDMQAVLKRCETLEKEVRSLKLNLSFMNRWVHCCKQGHEFLRKILVEQSQTSLCKPVC